MKNDGSDGPGTEPPQIRTNRIDDSGLRFRALLQIAGALALLLSICAGAAYLGIAEQLEAKDAAHAELIDASAGIVRDQLLAATADLRGYLQNGGAGPLQAYNAAMAPIGGALDQLDALLTSTGSRAEVARRLRQLVQARLAELRRAVALASTGQPDAARALMKADSGVLLGEEIDATLSVLQKSVGAERHRATRRQARSIALLMTAIAAAAVGAILMAALAARQVRRHLRLLHRRESQLDRLVASLEVRVARRTRALEETNQRFQVALNCARVTVFSQEKNLAYSWISQDFFGRTPEQVIGLTDRNFMPAETAEQLETIKLSVIATGQPATTEIRLDNPPSTTWYELNLVATQAADGTVNGLIGGAADISERKNFESHVRLLIREVTHRSKNLLAVVQALMRQTAAHATSIDDFSQRFAARLDSLAGAYDLLIKDDWRGTTMDQLVRSQVARFAAVQDTQIDISGPEVQVPPDATQNIGMALHELATNAGKFGALSVPTGRVRVHWQIERDERDEPVCRIWWQESGGPPVAEPGRRGFGQVVIERTVARAVGGRVTLAYNPGGVEWMLVFPLRA